MTDTPADAPIHTLTPAEAAVRLNELDKAFRGPPPSATPQTSSEARVRLQQLTADSAWAEKLEAGDVDTRKEFTKLTELAAKDQLADAIIGPASEQPLADVTIGGNELTARNTFSAAEGLREAGFNDTMVLEVITGKTFTADEVAIATDRKSRAMRDPVWQELFLSGDPQSYRDMLIWNGIITAGVSE
jgi:hypothetical protein